MLTCPRANGRVLILNPHWKTVLWPFVLLVVVAVAAAVLLIVIPHNRLQGAERIAVGVVAIVIAAIWVGVPILRWKTTTYELTTRRFRLRYGVLSRTGRDFPLIRISDVSFSHGLIDRMLGCGRLVVESAGEHGQLVLNEIPERREGAGHAVPAGRGRAGQAGPGGPLAAALPPRG